MTRLLKTSFSRGEIAPALYGRVGTELYQTALRTARNVVVHTTGGVSKRPGSGWIGPVADHTYAPRMIRFQFKTTDQYILEFGDFYMRVIRDDGHVLDTSVTDAIEGATQASPVVLTMTGHPFSNGQEIYISGVSGMTELNGRRFIVANATANTVELTSQIDGTNIDGTGYSAWTSGGTVDKIYEIATPYAIADVPELVVAQSADVMTITHRNYDARELTRLDHDNWVISTPTFGSSVTTPSGITVTPDVAGGIEYKYRVTAISADNSEESLPGLDVTSATITGATQANPVVITTSAAHNWVDNDEVFIDSIVGMTELNGRRFIVVNTTATTAELLGEDGTSYTAYSSGGTATQTLTRILNGVDPAANTVAWNEVSGADRYGIYKFQNGAWGLIGESEGLSFYDDNITADASISHPRSRNPFRGTDNKPGVVSFYEQRRVFGGTNNSPDTEFFSQVGSYNNMNVSSPLLDSDAITASLASLEVNEIRHFVPLNNLLVFTSGAEWRVDAGDNSYFAASTIKQKPQSYWGCSYRRPLVIGDTVVFVDDTNATVRSLGWSFQANGYTGVDLSFLASHLFRGYSVVDWTMQRSPEARIYVVRDDGKMLTLTYDADQQVVAWTHWDTDGKYEAVETLRGGGATGEDSVYAVVKRTINGKTVRYIEVYRDRYFDMVEDAYFVDSGLSLDTPIDITDVTLANPVVVRAPAHGLSEGDTVDINDITWVADVDATFNETQPAQLNNYRYVVKNIGDENLLTYSEQFDNAAWAKTRCSITADAEAAPDGASTADKIVEDSSASTTHFVQGTASFTNGSQYTFSVYLKAGEDTQVQIELGNTAFPASASKIFDVSAGTASGTGTGLDDFAITSVGNGWYRCSITSTADTTVSSSINILLRDPSSGTSFTGDGTSGLYIWGAQLERSSETGTYTKTEATPDTTADTFELYEEDGVTPVDGTAFNAYVEGGYVRKAVTTLTGLWHLEGKTLTMLVDGNVVTNKTVADGSVTLDRKSSRIHAGLGYIADVELLNVEAQGGETLQGKITKIPKVTVRFEKSRGMFIGPDTSRLVEMKQRQFELIGQPTQLLTGDKEVTLLPDWNSNGRVFMRNPYPLPFKILAVMPSVYAGSEE